MHFSLQTQTQLDPVCFNVVSHRVPHIISSVKRKKHSTGKYIHEVRGWNRIKEGGQ